MALVIKLDKDEYYENEAVTGVLKLKMARELKDFQIRLDIKYHEHYVLFNESGDAAL